MRRGAVVLILVLASLSAAGGTNERPVNLGFESGAPGEVPPGWFSPATQAGYTVALSTEKPKQGKQCVRVSGKPKRQEGRPPFGNVMQAIDAGPYRGKTVRLRGAVRVEGAEAWAAMWMRVDRPNRAVGFFDNMQDRPIRSKEWAYYEIIGEVAADATVLNVGMMLQQEGTAWLDDVTIEVTTAPVMRAAAPRALTPRGLENLVAFARLFGIVRYFHPGDEAAAADWDAIAVNGAELVERATDVTDLAARLGDVFLPLAPTLRIHPAGSTPAPFDKPATASMVFGWEHLGLASKDPRSIYRSERIRRGVDATDRRIADPLQPFRVDLGGGLSASVPLAVFADGRRTLPAPDRKPLPASTAAYTGNDRATRIGAVVILWNALRHFYPYFDVVDADWPSELPAALRAAATDRDEAAFLRTLRRLTAALDDGHAAAMQTQTAMRPSLPLLWRTIGDALVITAADTADVQVGDEVLAIDGKPALQALREAEELVSGATPQWRRHVALYEIAAGRGSAVLTIRNAGGTARIVTLPRSMRSEPLRVKRPEKIAELKPGLWYLDLERISDADFTGALEKLKSARGIVFDMRGYPRNGLSPMPLRHLLQAPAQSPRWNVPIVRRPNLEGVEWSTNGRWTLQPLQPRLTKNVVFLTDARAISYAESWMGIVEAYELGKIVGEPTAGTNGNVNLIDLPGNYRAVFTGMKVLKHDGSRHHGVGIAPTVPVLPTVAGVRAGRDEQLEKAVEVLEAGARQ